jgi:hypothetical protein
MTAVTATYRSDDLEIVFSGTESRGDDPTWGSVDDISIESAELCGVALDLSALPGVLIAALTDRADNLEWHNA